MKTAVMTDLETIKAMLERAGVVYTERTFKAGDLHDLQEELLVLEMEALAGPYNVGYPQFMADLYFTPEGQLRAVGAWE